MRRIEKVNTPERVEIKATYREYFDSVGDAIDYVDTTKPVHNEYQRMASYFEPLSGVIERARKGWPEGLEKVRAIGANFTGGTAEYARKRKSRNVACGGRVHIGRYLGGEVECMRRRVMRNEQPIIRIGANLGAHGGQRLDSIATRGAAIIALSDALEASGYTVEIDYCSASRGANNPYQLHAVCIPVKKSGEYIEPDKLAFWLCNDGAFRGITFACRECDRISWSIAGSGMGSTAENESEFVARYDIFIKRSEASLMVLDTARQWVIKQAQRFGVEVS